MLPIAQPVLSLEEIAERWSREMRGIYTSDEIFGRFLAEFWRGRLHVTGANGVNKVDRLAFLKIVNRRRAHPGFTLIESAEERPPASETLPDGSVRVDMTSYITVPSDAASWTDELLEAAYAHLATMSFENFSDLIKPGFAAFCTTREALGTYCEAMGYDPPLFWGFGKDRSRRWNTRRENEARAWLKQIVAGRKQKPKSGYFEDARKEFPGIPRDAFDRIWTEVAPPAWKTSGPVVRTPGVRMRS
jgi:hypothetical protein